MAIINEDGTNSDVCFSYNASKQNILEYYEK
jgi:hypothetical protein